MEYIVNFKINSKPHYKPVMISCRLPEAQALILMATPVTSIGISVQRASGMIIDAMPEAVNFEGDKPK